MKERKAKLSWIGPELRLVVETEGGPAVVLDHILPDDEREAHEESGPRPLDMILFGLMGCTAMDVVSIMKKKRQPFTDLEVHATAERAEEHPKVYTRIHMEFVAKGEGVELKALERSVELSETKYCPAWAMLRDSVEITSSCRVEEA
jgi:putative redox protein